MFVCSLGSLLLEVSVMFQAVNSANNQEIESRDTSERLVFSALCLNCVPLRLNNSAPIA